MGGGRGGGVREENRGCDCLWGVSETKELSGSWAEDPPARQPCGFCSGQPTLLLGMLGVSWGRKSSFLETHFLVDHS